MGTICHLVKRENEKKSLQWDNMAFFAEFRRFKLSPIEQPSILLRIFIILLRL